MTGTLLAHTGIVGVPEFGQLVVAHRSAALLSQEQLAERSGLSVRGLRYLERGERVPYPDTVNRLVAALCLAEEDRRVLVEAAASRGRRLLEAMPVPEDVVGRDGDIEAIVALLHAGARLVTVVGPGGVGKTTVAATVGRELDREFAGGAHWAPLAQLRHSAEVPRAVWQALRVPSTAPDPLAEVSAAMSGEAGLLLLDNLEHLVEAGPWLADLLERCPGLHVVATSRVPLRIHREHAYQLAGLPLADAVRVFERRARRVDHRFVVHETNSLAVEAICRRIDGLPLAVELAAARVRALEPAEILHHLDRPLDLLADGPRDAPARQRSLRATIAWSHGLLGDQERCVLDRLAVFAGGASFEAVAAVRGDDAGLVDHLDGLVRSGLVRREAGEASSRYGLPEAIREYVAERLAEHPAQHADALDRHATYFARRAVEAGSLIEGPQQAEALARLDLERHDVRAAVDHLSARGRTTEALSVLTAIWPYFYIRGYAAEGYRRISDLLAASGAAAPDQTRAGALLAASQLCRVTGDLDSASSLVAESVSLYQTLHDRRGLAAALFGAGFVARVRASETEARELLTKALQTARGTGDLYIVAASLHHLAMLETDGGSGRRAIRELLERSLAAYRTLAFPRMIGIVLASLGGLERTHGRPAEALRCLEESLEVLGAAGEPREVHFPLQALADLAYDDGRIERAVTLASAAASYRVSLRGRGSGPGFRASGTWLTDAREVLGPRRYAEAERAGEALTPAEAVDVALRRSRRPSQ